MGISFLICAILFTTTYQENNQGVKQGLGVITKKHLFERKALCILPTVCIYISKNSQEKKTSNQLVFTVQTQCVYCDIEIF